MGGREEHREGRRRRRKEGEVERRKGRIAEGGRKIKRRDIFVATKHLCFLSAIQICLLLGLFNLVNIG